MPPNRRGNNNSGGGHQHENGHTMRPMKCCVPSECFQPTKLIYLEDIGTGDLEVVKVVCNNDHCDQGSFMHRGCFEAWEQSVLTYLRSCGRARSWSEKQRLQNLWTKRGYDLAFKACGCKCTKGHLRKDLDWTAPPRHNIANGGNGGGAQVQGAAAGNGNVHQDAENNGQEQKKKKKGKTKELRPSLSISAPVPHPNNNCSGNNQQSAAQKCNGTASHSSPISSTGSCSSVDYGLGTSAGSCSSGSVTSTSNAVNVRPRVNSLSSNGSGSSGGSGSPPSPPAVFGSPVNGNTQNMFRFQQQQQQQQQRKNSKGTDLLPSERVRNNSGSGGMFTRRMDFSSFNRLPRHKLNSYHIKMDDDNHGSDDTRTFIMQTLVNNKINRVLCVLCQQHMTIFDRYPLIDGTFYLSPSQHCKESIPTISPDGRTQYLNAVCMGCLEGWTTAVYCRCCKTRWDGSSLMLGSCYSYDIFAATPCCKNRLVCKSCCGFLMTPEQRPCFFSEYSRIWRCPHCGLVDFHMARPIQTVFEKFNNC